MAICRIDSIVNHTSSITLAAHIGQAYTWDGIIQTQETALTLHGTITTADFEIAPGQTLKVDDPVRDSVGTKRGELCLWINWGSKTNSLSVDGRAVVHLDVNNIVDGQDKGWDYIHLYRPDGSIFAVVECGTEGNWAGTNYSSWNIELQADGRLVLICNWRQGAHQPFNNPMEIGKVTLPPPVAIVGVGTDKNLYSRATLNDPWKLVPNSGSVTGVAVTKSGRVFGIGMDGLLYKRETLNSPSWKQLSGGGKFLAITAMGDGLLGVGMDNLLYTIDTAGNFSKVADSGSVFAVAAKADGSIWGLGTNPNQRLWKRAGVNMPPWTGPIGGGQFLAITGMADGNLLGVGLDNFLWTIDTAGNFNRVPNSGSVTAVACYL